MPVDYSKWDALELSDDSDIEVHPNVDKRSFIRAKQHQIHQQRQQRKHEIETLKYERVINDGLLSRIDRLLAALRANTDHSVSPTQIAFRSVTQDAATDDQPPPRPEGVHARVEEQPTYSKMMAILIDQVKAEVDKSTSTSDNLSEAYVKEIEVHRQKVWDLQSQLNVKLAELEKEEGRKITSESFHTGFSSSSVTTDSSKKSTAATESVEVLNPGALKHASSARETEAGSATAGVDTKADEDGQGDTVGEATKLGKGFAQIEIGDYRASHRYIVDHPAVMAERETDGLLGEAFNAVFAGNNIYGRQCVHQALMLQYCRALGRDGTDRFFKRISTEGHQAQKLFLDDVQSTFNRIRTRAAEMAQDLETKKEGVEQIQLHPVEPGSTINIMVPQPESNDPAEQESRAIFESFPPDLQRALESGSLDKVNEVLGRMSVEEAEKVVESLSEGGMLSMVDEIVDATTAEGQAKVREIERLGGLSGNAEEGAEAGQVNPGGASIPSTVTEGV